jgi:hypothetical protein
MFQIVAVDAGNSWHVGTVFRALYGEDFPVRDVYQPEVLWREIQAGKLSAALALNDQGQPVGYISFFKSAPNPHLWEAGNMLVDPAYAHSSVAGKLANFYFDPTICRLAGSDGIFSEAVCCHYFTQVGAIKAGMVDCALELDQLDGASFKDGKSNKAGMARVSCVLNFTELSDPATPQYLPARYEGKLRQLAAHLRPRTFLPSTATLPLTGDTVREDKYYDFAKTWKVAVRSIGSDWATIVAELLKESKRRGVVSLQLVLNTACPAIGAATEVLRKQGFFFGGLAPRWFDADGVVLQQLFDSEPDYEDTKLYSQEAKDLMAFIRADKEKIEGSNQPGAGIRQGR